MEAGAADLEICMEAIVEAAKISKREMTEATKEAKVKSASAKATTFLSFLVRVCTYRCTMFNIVSNVHGYV